MCKLCDDVIKLLPGQPIAAFLTEEWAAQLVQLHMLVFEAFPQTGFKHSCFLWHVLGASRSLLQTLFHLVNTRDAAYLEVSKHAALTQTLKVLSENKLSFPEFSAALQGVGIMSEVLMLTFWTGHSLRTLLHPPLPPSCSSSEGVCRTCLKTRRTFREQRTSSSCWTNRSSFGLMFCMKTAVWQKKTNKMDLILNVGLIRNHRNKNNHITEQHNIVHH